VVLPGQKVGKFSLGMTKEEALNIAAKPQENSPERLVYTNQKTGNILIIHFRNNRAIQIGFTNQSFTTAEPTLSSP
jgi:hypothetical protein